MDAAHRIVVLWATLNVDNRLAQDVGIVRVFFHGSDLEANQARNGRVGKSLTHRLEFFQIGFELVPITDA
jgi:hypothetical protein